VETTVDGDMFFMNVLLGGETEEILRETRKKKRTPHS
jgi:hypothetical protein